MDNAKNTPEVIILQMENHVYHVLKDAIHQQIVHIHALCDLCSAGTYSTGGAAEFTPCQSGAHESLASVDQSDDCLIGGYSLVL